MAIFYSDYLKQKTNNNGNTIQLQNLLIQFKIVDHYHLSVPVISNWRLKIHQTSKSIFLILISENFFS